MLTYASIASHPVKRFIPLFLGVYILLGSGYAFAELALEQWHEIMNANRVEAIVLGVGTPPAEGDNRQVLWLIHEDGGPRYTQLPDDFEVKKGRGAVFNRDDSVSKDPHKMRFIKYRD
jgi:hypothetical protein